MTGSDPSVPAGWPVPLCGVTESVVTTLGPNDRWNVAALGLHAPKIVAEDAPKTVAEDAPETDDEGTPKTADEDAPETDDEGPDAVTATTWGNTRTRRNFHRQGGGVVQFVSDPRTFVDAAARIREADDAVLPSAHAWVEVEVERIDAGASEGTRWERWALEPVDAEVRERTIPTINRGFAAVIEATVATSRLDVPAYDTDDLLSRLKYFAAVVDRCGGPREREAFAVLDDATGWRAHLPADADVPRFDAEN